VPPFRAMASPEAIVRRFIPPLGGTDPASARFFSVLKIVSLGETTTCGCRIKPILS